jgi:hypothetical protein
MEQNDMIQFICVAVPDAMAKQVKKEKGECFALLFVNPKTEEPVFLMRGFFKVAKFYAFRNGPEAPPDLIWNLRMGFSDAILNLGDEKDKVKTCKNTYRYMLPRWASDSALF